MNTPQPKTIAIGDIHGCSAALGALLELIDPATTDTVVALGDFVDRGPDSSGVLDTLIDLGQRCRLVPILGNHDEMLLNALDNSADFECWMDCGGAATLDSYRRGGRIDLLPNGHVSFLKSCSEYFETETHIFLHANYRPDTPLPLLDDRTLRWLSLRDYVPPVRHCSGKTAVVGHTPQLEVLDLSYLIGIDTACCKGGWLTALDVGSGQLWQVNQNGDTT